MTKLSTRSYKLVYTPANPSEFGSKPTYTRSTAFLCESRLISSAENVRAGRNASNASLRVFFRSRDVSFVLGDRVNVAGTDYDIMSIPTVSNPSVMAYIDVKPLQ